MTTVVNAHITRGIPWKKYITVKSKRTRYRVTIKNPSAFLAISSTQKKQISAEITTEGLILLELDINETYALPDGEYSYDVWADVTVSYGVFVRQPVARGILEVLSYDSVTPLEDSNAMEIRYKQRTDYRNIFTWLDDDGVTVSISDAYLQAETSAGVVVLDLRWYATTPSEETVIGLAAIRRGYLAPSTGASLEMHISNANTIAAGSYQYELFTQDSSGDWDCLVQGTLVVEASITEPPA